MDKNVSSVDLEELKKAREELDRERGVDTDPNMYSDYNPDRKEEETISNNYENITSEESAEETPSQNQDQPTQESIQEDTMINSSATLENFAKYDVFADFEVKENVNHKSDESASRTTNIEAIEKELEDSLSNGEEKPSEIQEETHLDDRFEKVENVDDLETLLDDLLEEFDEKDAKEDENLSSPTENTENNDDNSLASINIEPAFEESEESQKSDSDAEDYLASLLNESEDNTKLEEESRVLEETNDAIEEEPKFDIEPEKSESELEVEETDLTQKEESSLDDNLLEAIKADEGLEEETIEPAKPQETVENTRDFSQEIQHFDPSKARPSNKPVSFENSMSDNETEIITDYNQLKDILQRQLKESELESQERVEEDEGEKYEVIEEFKFINEIATDEFKESDKFSYILGKNEKGEMVYGNFREHFNLAVFGKNEVVTNSFLNSMILSLCLKNSTNDINFVMLDSDINSSFEVYNKSSYLYFNRIAKTNKEILDTLIEVTKELDARYDKLADSGLTNIEQFNDMAKETGTTAMPMLVVVFNNYTSASQATYIDKINACLYQILKFGRIAGIYAVVTAMLPIENSQVNYNLSSRISFKSDSESKYNVGIEGTHRLPDENDVVYFNISKNTTTHLKTATVTDTELDLIIKELEDEN